MATQGSGPRLVLIDRPGPQQRKIAALLARFDAALRNFDSPPENPCASASHVRLVLHVGGVGRNGLARLRQSFPNARVIVGSHDAGQAAAVRAFRDGADDFVWLGAGDQELSERVGHHLGEAAARAPEEVCGLVGESREIVSVLDFVRRVARSDVTVLVGGETGTGKECAALLLHRLSGRAKGPLVALNCAAIPPDLLESELFGFERGAFSGAVGDYPGKLKLADGGTLLLDEVGELSPAGQAKVLRAIERREAYRLGGRRPVSFDIRVVAASNRDLGAEMRAGRFREDLYYRLAVAELRMPALRERPEDIPALARHLLANVIGSPLALAPEAEATLAAHDWPGNVRELRNALEVASIGAQGGVIHLADLPAALRERPDRTPSERELLADTLRSVGGNKTAAARALNCSRMTLYRRLQRSGGDRDHAGKGVTR